MLLLYLWLALLTNHSVHSFLTLLWLLQTIFWLFWAVILCCLHCRRYCRWCNLSLSLCEMISIKNVIRKEKFAKKVALLCAQSPVWPDLPKCCHFFKNLHIFGNIFTVYFIFVKVLNPLWHNFYAFGQFFIVVNGQILKNNLAIWSHWDRLTHWLFFIHF